MPKLAPRWIMGALLASRSLGFNLYFRLRRGGSGRRQIFLKVVRDGPVITGVGRRPPSVRGAGTAGGRRSRKRGQNYFRNCSRVGLYFVAISGGQAHFSVQARIEVCVFRPKNEPDPDL